MRLYVFNVDIVGLFVLRLLFVGSCTGDWTSSSSRVEFLALCEVYGLFGAEGLVGYHVDAVHNYNREMCHEVYCFFWQHLFGSQEGKVREQEVAALPIWERMVWWGWEALLAID